MGPEGRLDPPADVGQDPLAEGLGIRGGRRGVRQHFADRGDGGPDCGDDDPAGNFRGRPAGFRRLDQHLHGRDFSEQFVS